ncbi:hypothetical protein RY831_20725 [Noviherbaspirillum sp. CPCC 100848]|uniref:Uncharacterized protein n=1 Tax=Noviherbaspirillum album TaxID=3080276 RepID=A0ABU6JD80_9BURK|nr:hypothetical protein [Noviherbaspirillum sp. CPCC 100848]MEC4721595.1 hypothetical protein [Noviherbaspirillum sp. CPCC 100848]
MRTTVSAAKAVELELQHAREGMMYYTKLVENLEDVLETLAAIEPPTTAKKTTGRGRPAPGTKSKLTGKTRQAVSRSSGKSGLPPTGKEFWPTLLTDVPQPAAEIFKAAVDALGIRPSADDRKKLTQRMSNALSVMAKNGEIHVEGDRRTRRYARSPRSAS